VRISGGLARFAGAFGENVAFTSLGGVLELAHSQAYGGSISGFSKTGASTLDLDDIAYVGGGSTTALYSKATDDLTVTDGTSTSVIKLIGDYSASTFTTQQAAGGGTLVVDPATASAKVALFTASAATLGAGAGASSASLTHRRIPLAPLLAAHG